MTRSIVLNPFLHVKVCFYFNSENILIENAFDEEHAQAFKSRMEFKIYLNQLGLKINPIPFHIDSSWVLQFIVKQVWLFKQGKMSATETKKIIESHLAIQSCEIATRETVPRGNLNQILKTVVRKIF